MVTKDSELTNTKSNTQTISTKNKFSANKYIEIQTTDFPLDKFEALGRRKPYSHFWLITSNFVQTLITVFALPHQSGYQLSVFGLLRAFNLSFIVVTNIRTERTEPTECTLIRRNIIKWKKPSIVNHNFLLPKTIVPSENIFFIFARIYSASGVISNESYRKTNLKLLTKHSTQISTQYFNLKDIHCT